MARAEVTPRLLCLVLLLLLLLSTYPGESCESVWGSLRAVALLLDGKSSDTGGVVRDILAIGGCPLQWL
jgi:hypothetical protein